MFSTLARKNGWTWWSDKERLRGGRFSAEIPIIKKRGISGVD
jgi:hypothetical protein